MLMKQNGQTSGEVVSRVTWWPEYCRSPVLWIVKVAIKDFLYYYYSKLAIPECLVWRKANVAIIHGCNYFGVQPFQEQKNKIQRIRCNKFFSSCRVTYWTIVLRCFLFDLIHFIRYWSV
jgi:hypothetical protein